MELRPGTEADLVPAHRVFREAIEELWTRHRFEPPRPPEDVFVAHHAHLLRTGRFYVAEDAGGLAGFSAAIVRGDTWFLAALFVRPEWQASGLGTRLLEAVWDAPVRRRLTIVDAIQPVSTGMYSRRGLLPLTPLLCLGGRPAGGSAPALEPAEPDPEALALLDRAAYGFDRAPDHAFWREEARPTLWLRGGEPVGYAYRRPGARLGPLAGRTAEDAGATLAAELEHAAGTFVSLVVPGSARAALRAALAAGLRYTDPPGLLLSTEPVPPDALVPHGYSLF